MYGSWCGVVRFHTFYKLVNFLENLTKREHNDNISSNQSETIYPCDVMKHGSYFVRYTYMMETSKTLYLEYRKSMRSVISQFECIASVSCTHI